ncbi:hypothetical protein TSUD_382070 [Trifolium subterraneum]|uniref:Uncharacterized protein n=1 Tax=Trifolium subterraneum TaxID=3900 RepID=A0A2Z6MZ02_TRISU|nr:hypothetical protein TSUD_382070 [Trifolium subterraneum]
MNDMDISCSSLLLIEDSADSEGDSLGFFTLYHATNIGHKEDDAESCTYEHDIDDGICSLIKEDEDDKGSDEFCCDGEWFSSPLLDDDDDEETRMVNVNLNDVDDKLFWEICMEVGYP